MCRPLKIVLVLQFLPFLLPAQLTILVRSVSSNTPYDAKIYLSGNVNDWEAGDPEYVFETDELGIRSLQLDIEAGSLEYKFTRGSWETVEGTVAGGFRPNRIYNYSGGADTITVDIEGWEGQDSGKNNGTAAINVSIINEKFYMPQLDRHRRIWIYLPPDYAITTKRYPVLYMHDGQNLFDRTNTFSGEWEIDESLNRLFTNGDPGVIVVGIDHGDRHRIDEYAAWSNPKYGGGQGPLYADFIVETLKPYIDKHYRTLPDQASTGIMGSSMGGLISLFTVMEYQNIFGKVGIFSPSLWFSPAAFTQVSEIGKQFDIRFYLLAGGRESDAMESDMKALYNDLLSAGFQPDELQLVLPADGEHSEWFWARSFPDAYSWLFAEETPATNNPTVPRVQLRLNPSKEEVRISGTSALMLPSIEVFSVNGKPVAPSTVFKGNAFNTSFLKPGIYLFIIRDGQQIVSSEKLEIAK